MIDFKFVSKLKTACAPFALPTAKTKVCIGVETMRNMNPLMGKNSLQCL